jgi:hypothetical protein
VDIIKENMFFVVMGVIVLVAIALFFVFVQPLQSSNDDLRRAVKELNERLQGLLERKGKPPLANDVSIRLAKDYRKGYQEEVTTLEDMLKTKRLSIDLPGLKETEKDSPAAFKTVYQINVAQVKRGINEKRITCGGDDVGFWNWGEAVPDRPEQRTLAAKELSLIRELMAIIESPELEISQIDRLEVNPGETRTASYVYKPQERLDPYFDVYPFTLTVKMPFGKYELLLRDLLMAKTPIYIRDVSFGKAPETGRGVRRTSPIVYVIMRVEGWALDYRESAGGGETPRRPFGGAPRAPER